MRHLITFCLVLLCALGYGQTLDMKKVDVGGYGQKKLKKAPKKVYIASFEVYFQVVAEAEAKSQGGTTLGGGGVTGDTKTSMAVMLDGVDTPDFQQATDELYAMFMEDLKAKGYEIISPEVAAGIDEYDGWERREGGKLSYTQINGFVRAVPNNYSYFIRKESRKGREKTTFVDRTCKVSKQLDDAIIAEVSFAFPFVEMKTSSSGFVGFSKVKANVDFHMAPIVGGSTPASTAYSMIRFTSGNPVGLAAESQVQVRLKKKLPIEGEVFEDEKFVATTTASSTRTPSYMSIVWVEDRADMVTHRAVCDREKYLNAVNSLMHQMTRTALDELHGYALK